MEDELEPEIKGHEMGDDDLDDLDDPLLTGKKKPKAKEDDALSLEDLADEEEGTLDEDKFDDEDLW